MLRSAGTVCSTAFVIVALNPLRSSHAVRPAGRWRSASSRSGGRVGRRSMLQRSHCTRVGHSTFSCLTSSRRRKRCTSNSTASARPAARSTSAWWLPARCATNSIMTRSCETPVRDASAERNTAERHVSVSSPGQRDIDRRDDLRPWMAAGSQPRADRGSVHENVTRTAVAATVDPSSGLSDRNSTMPRPAPRASNGNVPENGPSSGSPLPVTNVSAMG